MNRESELVKNTLILSVGRFLPKLVLFITLPIMTGNLSKSDFGLYDLINTIVMLWMPIITLQIQSSAFRYLIDVRDNREQCKRIITNVLTITLTACAVVLPLSIFAFNQYGKFNSYLVALYLMTDGIYTIVGQMSRGLGHNRVFSESSFVLSLVNCSGILISLLLFHSGLNGVILSLLLSNAFAFLYLVIKLKLYEYIDFRFTSMEQIKELVAYSWPMIPNNLSTWVLSLSDRLVITAFLGIEANAVYAAANKVPSMLSMVQGVIVMAWQENASLAVNDKDARRYFSEMFMMIYKSMIGVTAFLIGVMPVLFKLLIRGDYGQAYVQMPILILAMFFFCMSSVYGGIYIAHKKTLSVGFSTMVAAGINLVVDFILVRPFGITAGSISTLSAYFFLFIFRMINIRKFQPMRYDYKRLILLIIAIIVMLDICFIQNPYLNVLNVILGIALLITLNYGTIQRVYYVIKRKLSKDRRI